MDYRTALITGASSGIGRALSLRIAGEGVEVVLVARRQDALEQTAEAIRGAGGTARVRPVDITDAGATRAAIQQVDDQVGGLDLVVACAGVSRPRWSGKLRWEDCAETIEVNVAGTVATLTAALEVMFERRRGHLAAVSSLAQYRGLPRFAAYSASKAFISTFLESLRVDLGSTELVVTDIRPGFVRTPINEGSPAKMPMLMEVDEAAEIIWRGLRARRTVVEFPWPLVAALRSARLLPNVLYDPTARKVL